MDIELSPQHELDVGRGTALLITGAVMVLLTWVLPIMVPIAVGAFGVYQLTQRQLPDGLLALAVAVVMWFLKGLVWWLMWLVSAGMVGLGLFFMLRGFWRGRTYDITP